MVTLLAMLACWRLTSLLVYESGPFQLFDRLRTLPFLCELLACFWCTSVWTAALLAVLAARQASEWLVTWLALSAGAILIDELRVRR